MSNAAAVLGRCKANEHYRSAVETPDMLDALALRDRAQAALLALLPGVPQPQDPDTADSDIEEFLAGVVAADAAERTRAVQQQALQRVVLACDGRIAAAAVDPDPICARLDLALAELMGRVGEVIDRLNGATTAGEAVARDVGRAWKELTLLRREYDELRTAQEWALLASTVLIDSRSQHVHDVHASDAMVGNLDSVWPQWNSPDTTIYVSGDVPRREPWPDDPVEFLVWAVESDARLWIPTTKQLADLHARRHRRLNPRPAGQRPMTGWTLPEDYEPEPVAVEHTV